MRIEIIPSSKGFNSIEGERVKSTSFRCWILHVIDFGVWILWNLDVGLLWCLDTVVVFFQGTQGRPRATGLRSGDRYPAKLLSEGASCESVSPCDSRTCSVSVSADTSHVCKLYFMCSVGAKHQILLQFKSPRFLGTSPLKFGIIFGRMFLHMWFGFHPHQHHQKTKARKAISL